MSELFEAYLPHIRQRWFDEQAGWELRRKQAWQTAKQVAALLRKSYAAGQIIAFGSLIESGPFDAHSDIDLAVGGIKPAHFLQAYGQAMLTATEFKLDLIDLDACPSQMRESILQRGVRL